MTESVEFNDEGAKDTPHPVEVKMELLDDDCYISNDGMFEVIPFMAKLLSNLKCSFYSKDNGIFISNIKLINVNELIVRLVKNQITPTRMDCNYEASSFSLLIGEDQIVKSPNSSSKPNPIVRFLAHMAIATDGTSLSIHIDRADIHIRSLTYDSLASLMVRLKQFDIRPKQVDSMSNSLFSLVFNETSFLNSWHALKCYGTETSPADVDNIQRSRICPNYKEETAHGGDLMPTPLSRSSPITEQQNFSVDEFTSTIWPLPDSPNAVVKRGRGRPRNKPRPTELSLDSNQIKKPRGRPRRSDVDPSVITRTNSFINIQPKSMSAQELENCFAKFLESDMCHTK